MTTKIYQLLLSIQTHYMNYLSIFFIAIASLGFSQTTILLDDFQSGIPVNYTLLDNDGFTPDAAVSEYTSAWIIKTDPENASNQVASATSYFDPIGRADRWLITPQLNLGVFGNYVSWQAKSHDASYPEDYYVLGSTTGTAIEDFTDTLAIIGDESEYWATHQLNLSEEGYDNASVHLAFVLRTYDGFKLYVDSIHIWKEDPVGVQELTSTSTFSVFPNPTVDKVTISSDDEIIRIRLTDFNGKEMLQTTEHILNLSRFSAGIYFVEVQTSKGSSVKRILKK